MELIHDSIFSIIIKTILAFGSIMFAFAGASTFPTIQTDMRNRELFPKAAVFGMLSKGSLQKKKTIFLLKNSPFGGGGGVGEGPCHKKTIASKSFLSNFKHF